MFMQPGTFHITRQIDDLNITIYLNEVRLQLSQEAGSVSPAQPGLSVVVNQGGRV